MKDYKNNPFPLSTPEEQGIPSAAIIHFLDRIRENDLELHSLQVVRNGKLCINTVVAPFTFDSFHRIFSAAKGVVATAVLFAVQDGYFDLNDLVVPLLPAEWIPENLNEKWSRLTIYHLLTMTAGHDQDSLFLKMWGKSDCWIKSFFEYEPVYEPGTHFCYDMGAQYVLNELIRNKVGLDTGRYLDSRLFRKLNIAYTANYTEPEGLFFSSSIQFHLDTLTKLAQFYLQKGVWNGERLLREDLALLIGRHHVPSFHYDPKGISGQIGSWDGYGLHVWCNRCGGFSIRGGQGQVGMVIPPMNMVIGLHCSATNYQDLLDILAETIIGESFYYPVKEDPLCAKRAQYMLDTLNLAPYNVSSYSQLAQKIHNVVYDFEDNVIGLKHLSFSFDTNHVTIHAVDSTSDKTISCGIDGEWLENHCGYILNTNDPRNIANLDRIFGYDVQATLCSGGWSRANTFKFYIRSHSLLSDYRYECEFYENNVFLKIPYNAIMPRSKYKKRADAPDIYIMGKHKEEI